MTYIPPVYPTTIPTVGDLPDRVDDVDWLYAARYNELKKELRAALTELGTTPKGDCADVATRLTTMQQTLFEIDLNGDLQPVTETQVDGDFELDGNDDIQPKTI